MFGRMSDDAEIAQAGHDVAQHDVRYVNADPPVNPAPFGDDFKFEVF